MAVLFLKSEKREEKKKKKKEKRRRGEKEGIILLVNWCFESSQPLGATSGL